MEWSREKTLALIQEYRKRRGLWDMTHDDYRKKEFKNKLLMEVSESLGGNIAISEIEKKFHTLRTQYHREINRMKIIKPYHSKWFGFKYLQFLSSPKACRSNKGRIKSEITEDGTVTTKYIIRESVSHDASVGSGTGGNGSNNDNEEFITLQTVTAKNGCSTTNSRTHELEKLIEETTKDVEEIEDSKPKMTLKEITVPLEHHQHEYSNAGELQISSVESDQQEVNHIQDVDENMDTINLHTSGDEDIAYQGTSTVGSTTSTMGVSTVMTAHSSSGTTVHPIPTRIIKIQRRDTVHDNGEYYDNNPQSNHAQSHHHHHHHHQQQPHIHTISSNAPTAAKRIYYDASSSGHHTATILADATSPAQTTGNLTLLNTTTSSPPSPHSSKIQVRSNLTSSHLLSPAVRDEFSTYGEYVANEMRGLKTQEILISLKHKINTALFEASMAELQK
uniref:MADF domain-containing protein n=1 Tax=Glossina austeni TaxID=7395 RepID=A0A1A9UYZ6_GLOAU